MIGEEIMYRGGMKSWMRKGMKGVIEKREMEGSKGM
jgi:hypothetical protein